MNIRISTRDINKLTNVHLRQEKIYEKNGLTVINDSTATSPEALNCAIDHFSQKSNPYFIVGGTDKQLDYSLTAEYISKKIPPAHLILLSGSGTKKLITELTKLAYFAKYKKQEFYSLEECVKYVSLLTSKRPTTVIFSPGGSSFELFKNEFDRGNQFNLLAKKYFL